MCGGLRCYCVVVAGGWWWVVGMLLLLLVVIYLEHHSLQNVTHEHQFEIDFLTNSLLIKTFPKFIITRTKEPNRIG